MKAAAQGIALYSWPLPDRWVKCLSFDSNRGPEPKTPHPSWALTSPGWKLDSLSMDNCVIIYTNWPSSTRKGFKDWASPGMGEFVSLCPHVPVSLLAARDLSRGREPCGWVPSPAGEDLLGEDFTPWF